MPSCGITHEPDEIYSSPGRRPGETWLHTPAGCHLMTSREWAADMLAQISHAAAHGAWPAGLSAFDLGRAMCRAAGNIAVGNVDDSQQDLPDTDAAALRAAALEEFTRGWRAADSVHGPVDRDDVALPANSTRGARPAGYSTHTLDWP